MKARLPAPLRRWQERDVGFTLSLVADKTCKRFRPNQLCVHMYGRRKDIW
jgi:hypothetical protein